MSSLNNHDNKTEAQLLSISRARELVLAQGWNSTSYQIINPGIRHWFSKADDAVIGFVSCHGVRVVVGAPICAEERLKEIAAEFELDATHSKEQVCYLAAEARLESIYVCSQKHAKVLLGAQPVWHPHDWNSIVVKHKSLRAQLNRASNKGVTVEEWSTEKAHNNPELLECLNQWLNIKGLPPLHFMVEPYTLSRLYDRRVFVAECTGKVVGYVILSPVSQRNGWLFEQFVYKPGAPNGSVELMIDYAMRAIDDDGYKYATLGLSPLSTRASVAPFRNPFWLRILLAWMRIHGQRFYNFDGLDAFKAKLRPAKWEPVFAIYNESYIPIKAFYAIASAFSENKPVKLILGGLRRALMTEIRWVKQKVSKMRFSNLCL
jgi:phosphatidylglycerol lysyltransferase